MLNIRNDEKTLFDIAQLNDKMLININNQQKIYEFEDFEGFKDKWYAVMLCMYKGLSTMWVYEFEGSEEAETPHTKFKLVGKSSNDFGKYDFGETCYYDVMSCNIKFTNFRLWSQMCEEEMHELLLSQYVVDDTHNTLIVDNSQSELLLNNKWS